MEEGGTALLGAEEEMVEMAEVEEETFGAEVEMVGLAKFEEEKIGEEAESPVEPVSGGPCPEGEEAVNQLGALGPSLQACSSSQLGDTLWGL